MNDDAIIKVMSSLGLDYNPAIDSTLNFGKSIEAVNKQLARMKANAMQSANSVNSIFSSQLGQFAGNRTIVDQFGRPFRTIQDEARAAAQPVSELSNTMNTAGNSATNMGNQFVSSAIQLHTLRKVAREVTETIKDVEMGMIEIQRVMTDSSFVFEDYRSNLLQLGIEYGQTFDNVQKIALRWTQSGYNVADSLELTKTSLLALNTAELNATQATEAMIGIMAQWNLQAEDMALVMDKVNITADRNAVTSQDLVDGLLRSSGAAKIMNLSLDETIGLLTVMREASGRTGREVGNALNSILSYIQRPGSIRTFEGLGIDVFADAAKTQFRNVLDIFKDIAVNWNTLSADIQDGFVKSADDAGLFNEEIASALGSMEEWNDLQQRDISQAAAGVYRRNYFIGMIERLSDVQGVLNNLMEAEGYSMRENAKTMETLEKKTESLKTAAESLAVAVGETGLIDVFKLLVDAGTGAIKMFNALPDEVQKPILAFAAMSAVIKTGQLAFNLYGISVNAISTALGGLTTSAGEAANATRILGLATNQWTLLLAGAAAVGSLVYTSIKKHREEMDNLADTYSQFIQDNNNKISQMKELAKSYNELEKKSSLTSDEQEKFYNISNQIAELAPSLVKRFDEHGNAVVELKGNYEDLIEEMKRANEIKMLEMVDESPDYFKSIAKDIKDAKDEIERFQKHIESINSGGLALIDGDLRFTDGLDSLREKMKKDQDEFEKLTDAERLQYQRLQKEIESLERSQKSHANEIRVLNNEIEGLTNKFKPYLSAILETDDAFKNLSGEAKDVVSTFANMPEFFLGKNFNEQVELLHNLANALQLPDTEKIITEIRKLNSNVSAMSVEEYNNKLQELIAILASIEGINIDPDKLFEMFNISKSNIDDTAGAIRDSSESLKKLSETIEEATGKIADYNNYLKEYNKTGKFSGEVQQEIIDKYPALLGLLGDERALRDALQEALEEEKQVQMDLYYEKVQLSEDFINARVEGEKTLREKLAEYYNIDLQNSKNLAEAKKEVEIALLKSLSEQWSRYYNFQSDTMTSDYTLLETLAQTGNQEAIRQLSAIDNAASQYRNISEGFKSVALELSGFNFDRINTSNIKQDKKEKYENKALEEALKLLEHRKRISEETQDTIKAEIAELNRINSLYVKTQDERMSMAERIYTAEKRLRDRTLQDSVNWINEKKNLNELSVEEEIAAWERVAKNQSNNIEAVKQATLNLYKLRNQITTESFAKEENSIKHLTKLGILSVEEQIKKYKELYEVKASTIAEEQSRVENLFDLYKKLISDQQRTVKNAYDERIKQIDEEAKRKKSAQDDIIKGIEKELELLNKQEQEYDHDKKMADLKEQLAYWQVRTSEDARKKVAELLKQIDEEEHKREVELKKQSLEDKKKIAQDEVKTIEDTAREEREKWEKSYRQIEIAFDEHSIDMIALASTMSKGMFEEFKNNYLLPLETALRNADYGSVDSILGGVDSFAKDAFDKTYNSNNAQIHRLASSILDLKRQYELGGDKSAAQRAVSIYDELSSINSSVANNLHKMNYMQAQEYVRNLPKMHKGGKALSYGAVEMMPGELTFPPDLSTRLESLITVLYQRPMSQSQTFTHMTDRRVIQNFNAPLYNSERTIFEDIVDGEILAREMARAIKREGS